MPSDANTLSEPINGLITKLSKAELELVDKGEDPKGFGVFYANIVNCSLGGIELGIYAANQDERHPDTYTFMTESTPLTRQPMRPEKRTL